MPSLCELSCLVSSMKYHDLQKKAAVGYMRPRRSLGRSRRVGPHRDHLSPAGLGGLSHLVQAGVRERDVGESDPKWWIHFS